MAKAAALSLLLICSAASAGALGRDAAMPCATDQLVGIPVSGRYGYVILTGWALDPALKTPIGRAELRLDGRGVGDVILGSYRPDLVALFGKQALWGGWMATASLEHVSAGLHHVEFLAVDANGLRHLCGSRDLAVRFFAAGTSKPFLEAARLTGRTVAFLSWLTLVGWGLLRSIGRRFHFAVSPALGLAAMAVAIEGGAIASVRPLAALLTLTVVVFAGISVSLARERARRIRVGKRRRAVVTAVIVVAIAAIFAIAAGAPYVAHPPGVLGLNTDAAWESSVAESIVRYGWKIPPDVAGHYLAVPREWRRLDVRAGAPYPLAALAQSYGILAHETHSTLMLSLGVLAILGTAAAASRLFPHPASAILAASLMAVSSIPLVQMYNQHVALLLALVLYLGFAHELFDVGNVPTISRVAPLALLIAGGITLYPESIPIWIATAVCMLVAHTLSSRRWKNTLAHLVLATALAAILNPVALARLYRWGRATTHEETFASPEKRTVFGDTHYFPPVDVIAGIREYRIDRAAPVQPWVRAARRLTYALVLAVMLLGWWQLRWRHRLSLICLTVPLCAALLYTRWLEFPYGFTKALPEAAAVWAVGFAVLAVGSSFAKYGKHLVAVALVMIFGLSLPAALAAVSRASQTVPAFDPAFQYLPDLAREVRRDIVITVSPVIFWQQEWLAYALGENRVMPMPSTTDGVVGNSLRLVDLRAAPSLAGARVVRQNGFFALIQSKAVTEAGTRDARR